MPIDEKGFRYVSPGKRGRGGGSTITPPPPAPEEEIPPVPPPPNPIAEGPPLAWTPEQIAESQAELAFNPEEPSPEWIPPATAALATLWAGANEEQYNLWAQSQPTKGRTMEGYGGGGGGGGGGSQPKRYSQRPSGRLRPLPGRGGGGGGEDDLSNQVVFQPNLQDLSDVITPKVSKYKPTSLKDEKEYKSKSVTPWVYSQWVITMGQWRGF